MAASLLGKAKSQESPTEESRKLEPKQEKAPKVAYRLPVVDRASLGLRLRTDDVDVEVRPIIAIEGVAGHLINSSRTRHSSFLLLWPGSLRSLTLAHAVGTASLWQSGNKQGLRTMIYPAKANFLHALNHAHLDKSDLVKLALDLYENAQKANPRVTVSFREKDALWLSLNNIKASDAERVHPSLAELIPHFFADSGFEKWQTCDGDMLRHVKSSLKSVKDKRLLGSLATQSLSEPDTAPDAIFALSWRATRQDIRNALRALERARRPDVLLVDLTRALRKKNPGWKANAVMFLECARKAWPVDTPPVVFVSDEPWVRGQLQRQLLKASVKKSDIHTWLSDADVPLYGEICTLGMDGLLESRLPEADKPSAKEIQVAITDTEAAELVAQIEKLSSELAEEQWIRAIEAASSYVETLTALPSSTKMLVAWLGEADVPMAIRQNYAWPVYRSRLEQILNDPTFRKRAALKRIIDRGNALWENYSNGTPLARKLADLIEEHTRGHEKCRVVFTRPTARRLAERYFEEYDGYPEGAGFEVLRDCVKFMVSRELETELKYASGDTLIFAGLDEESLRTLILSDRISSPTYVLLTRRNAAYLKATLRAIDKTAGFDLLRPRVGAVLRQLPEFPAGEEKTIFTRADFVLPTFSFEQGLAATFSDCDEQDNSAWELILDSGITVRRNPHSKLYLYDPSQSHAVTRGFRAVDVSTLEAGDHVFVMSFELRELTESALKAAGAPISNDKHFENDLRKYHDRVGELVAQIPGVTLTDKARSIQRALEEALGDAVNMPAEGTLRSWLDVERFRGRSFEDARPSAPRVEPHFRALAQAIGLDAFEATYFWRVVIQPLRGVRRADGRRVSDAYSDLLLEPESIEVHGRLSHSVVQDLYARAKDNVHLIEAINKPQGGVPSDRSNN
ncbi:hypothetical protein [Tahibacter soli]|uniref:Uncharacterized protein n=1 Tax=Tahibacter soli TaxID=2983605 RepID=A0A9X3YH85_9GAMM|nr:hypothetical protein [Tahibacter soli]MDC8010985.1 hypothetical protein [Tahibacter soli]